MSVWPRPMIAAPSSWPRTWIGLSALPTSDTVTWRATVTSPVSRSTSTSTAVQLNSKNAAVPPSGWSGLGLLAHLADADDLAAEPAEPADQDVADRQRRGRRSRDLAAIDDDRRPRRPPRAAAAIARSFAWTSRQACRTALPIRTEDRLADVCWSYGTTAVSPMTTVTQSSGAPSSWAAIWAKIVRAPWPMSDVPAWTMTLPSASRRTVE